MNNKETIGTITTDSLFLNIALGDGKTDDGKKFDLAVTAAHYEPLVICGRKTFHLSWQDICALADQAGLFEDEKEAKA